MVTIGFDDNAGCINRGDLCQLSVDQVIPGIIAGDMVPCFLAVLERDEALGHPASAMGCTVRDLCAGRTEPGRAGVFRKNQPVRLQEMAAVMLETARKGYWQPGEQVLKSAASLHAELVARFGPSGTDKGMVLSKEGAAAEPSRSGSDPGQQPRATPETNRTGAASTWRALAIPASAVLGLLLLLAAAIAWVR